MNVAIIVKLVFTKKIEKLQKKKLKNVAYFQENFNFFIINAIDHNVMEGYIKIQFIFNIMRGLN